jgi:hypothetical protein
MIFAFSGEPMGYEHLFGKSDLALLYDWLQETGELYMDLDRPHSGGSNNGVHFIESLAALKGIVSHERHPEVYISIFRLKQYPIRGIVGDSLLATVLEQIPDRQWFSIVSLGDGPLAPCNVIGFGDCHDEMREEFARLEGKHRCFWPGSPLQLRRADFMRPLTRARRTPVIDHRGRAPDASRLWVPE